MSGHRYVVGVRALCEFTARSGDLDRRFTPSPSAQEGIVGHRLVAARRGAGYQTEVAVACEYGNLTVRGRADGYDAAAGLLEEIKTHRGDLDRMPANHRALHWAQARVYGALLCRQLGLDALRIALVYLDVVTQIETRFEETRSADELQREFERHGAAFLTWSEQELAHRAARDASLRALRFPHADFRAGQRDLAEGVYRAAAQGRCLVAQAPTGIGKTIGTVFPLLKAWPGQGLDRIFFLTAKEPGRRLALDALARLADSDPGLRLRSVELVAREKACEHPDKACHGDSCALARGFYDRLPQARSTALATASRLDRGALRDIARDHAVCPYYLGQELVRWADVVVGDYNHYFDLNAVLHALTVANEWKVAVLADEAHNLLDRARGMYSATLDRVALTALRRSAPPLVAKALARLGRQWTALHDASTAAYEALEAPPAGFTAALQQAGAAIAEHLAEHPAESDAALLAFYFDVLHFQRLLELFGTHSLIDVRRAPGRSERAPGGCVLGLRNLVPGPHLERRFAAAHCSVLFSATLTPMHFHRDTLGLPTDAVWLDVASPFRPEQLEVRIAVHISTRYHDRDRSLAPIADLMAQQFAAVPGNYLAFFSSFEYLEKALARFAAAHADVPVWQQSRGMEQGGREAFLARFTDTGRGIGFAVLGGAFGEAIDLPGPRLIGAFVATLGLPPIDPLNEEMRRRMDRLFGNGYDYTYLYPGLQRVVQAVGRVIRSGTDTGVVHLIDDRFRQPEVRRLFPAWWQIDSCPT